jgi:hypothetical protein
MRSNGRNRCEEGERAGRRSRGCRAQAEPRAREATRGEFLRTKFVLLFILLSSRKGKNYYEFSLLQNRGRHGHSIFVLMDAYAMCICETSAANVMFE